MRIPELLVPAGNLDKLITALHYGADAVYLGVERFGLRSQAGNLTCDELVKACAMAHDLGRKIYLTLNASLRHDDVAVCRSLLQELKPVPVDAYIVADPGMLQLVQEVDPGRCLHLSTQANTTNAYAAHFWQSQGVKRLNLARELDLDEIRVIRRSTEDLELEMFVHGAMCVAYSGRCLLSTALAGRSANQGNCAQPCRWEYSLQEAMRPGEYLPIEEDGQGTYLMNSRDLCLIDHLPELIEAGIDSLKVEGRMKSLYYVAAVTRVYRAALDAYLQSPEDYRPDPRWRKELDAVSHRPYSTGFLFGDDPANVHPEESVYQRKCDFVGVVLEKGDDDGWWVEGRNRFLAGEELEVLGPGMRQAMFTCPQVAQSDGTIIGTVQPNARVSMALPAGTKPGDLLRRWC